MPPRHFSVGFVETHRDYHAAYEPQRSVRTRRWKDIRRFDEQHAGPVPANTDDGPSKTLWLEHGWLERPVAREQLYDLVFDPNEAADLAQDPTYAPVLDELRARLERWMRETGDPLADGPVPAPAGALVNDRDDVSPEATPTTVDAAVAS